MSKIDTFGFFAFRLLKRCEERFLAVGCVHHKLSLVTLNGDSSVYAKEVISKRDGDIFSLVLPLSSLSC